MKQLLCLLLTCISLALNAQEWWFWPDYTLGQKANNYPGNRLPYPQSKKGVIETPTTPLNFMGEEPTERVEDFVPADQLPSGPFTVELWLLNHVNQPIGVLAALKSRYTAEEPAWLVGVYNRSVFFSLRTADNPFANLVRHEIRERGFKQYWHHVVAVYTGNRMELFVNGRKQNELAVGQRAPARADFQAEVAAYMKNEPYMKAGNFLKMLRIHPAALTQAEITKRFGELQSMVVEGRLFPNLFHFNAGPYLNLATKNSVNLVWETDRPADFVIEYGRQLPPDQRVELNTLRVQREGARAEGNIYEVTLSNLEPQTPYFYNIKAKARDGAEMESGVLTFATAVPDQHPFAFAVLGDTEARPHINDRVCKLVWDERPNLVVIVGDLTDGGKEGHKFEWNYEYFQGITQLASRIPVFPVAGNGEGDLHWYNRYHRLPESEAYYSFSYGNAEFFMLNSNQPAEFAPGGAQYRWLDEKLRNSKAQWKFVAHHHAPYSGDDDDYGDSWKGKSNLGDPDIRKIVPLYEKYSVDMVFFGHLHTYQRTLPIKENKIDRKNGVIYVQGGGSGGNLEDFAPTRAWFSAKTYRGHHYFMVSVSENTLNLKMYDTEGRLRDYLDVEKP
jgi:Icc-related predicted phosphoesterase